MGGEKLPNAGKIDSGSDGPGGQPTNKQNGNHQEHLPSGNGDGVRKFGVVTYIGEIVLAGLCGTGVWIFGEHLVSHGYEKSGVVVNFLAFVIYFAAAPITAIRFWPKPWRVWGSFGAFVAIMAIVFIVTSHQAAESKAYAHFKFSLYAGGASNNVVELTNDFLFVTNPEKGFPLVAALCLPTQIEQSNVTLNLLVQNDSSVLAENVEISFFVEPYLECSPGFGWEPNLAKASSGYVSSSGVAITNSKSSWFIRIPASMLSGDAIILPRFQIKRPEDVNRFCSLDILARAKDSPAETLACNLIFISIPTNISSSYKPFIIPISKNSNGVSRLDISPKRFEELLK